MKSIFNGKLYDTDKSEKLCDDGLFYSVWKTQKGELFLVSDLKERVFSVNQDDLKNILGQNNPDKYIELFGEVEEA